MAASTVVLLARITGAPTIIAHISHPEVLDIVTRGRQEGARRWAESCPHYFYLSEEDILKHGPYRKCAPPVRSKAQTKELWPQKGNLRSGADADIVIVDMNGKQTLSNDSMLSRSGWTPYEGVKVQGFPVATYVRGERVASEGRVVAKPGTGQFLPGPGLGT